MVRFLSLTAAVVIMLAALAWYMSPAQYEAFALLRVADKPASLLRIPADEADGDYAIFKRTQIQLLTSGPVLRSVVRIPAISRLPTIQAASDDPVAWLRDHLKVDYPDNAEIMRVSLHGDRMEDLVPMVDAVVDKYLAEVVMRDRDLRLQQQAKLEKKYDDILSNYNRESQALHDLEKVYKTSSTDAAQVTKKLVTERFEDAVSTRNYLKRQLLECELAIVVMRPPEAKPAEKEQPAEPATPAVIGSSLTLEQLENKRAFIEEKLALASADVVEAAKAFENVTSFSSQVSAKQEELAMLKQIMNELRSQLNHAQLDRLAEERITKVDDAVVVSINGDQQRRYAGLAAAAAISLGLVVIGVSVGRRPHNRAGF